MARVKFLEKPQRNSPLPRGVEGKSETTTVRKGNTLKLPNLSVNAHWLREDQQGTPRNKMMKYCWQVLVLILVLSFCDRGSATDEWLCGTARAKITPSTMIWMAGYGSRDRPAEGKLTDLWAKALVLDDQQGNQAVLITFDIIGVERSWTQRLTETLEKELGYSRENIAINTSHTHTGPVIGLNLRPMHFEMLSVDQQEDIINYSLQLQDQVVEIVREASSNLQPATLTWGNGRSTFAVNRRNNRPEGEVPARRTAGSLVGPVDHDVPVLAVRDADEQLVAVVFGYACHATVLSFYQWSGDYPGFAQIQLEERFPGCQAMFWAGCGADQNPLPRRTVELAQHYGKRLATAVESVLLTSQMQPVAASLEAKYQEIELALDELPSREQIEEDSKSGNKFIASRARALLRQIDEQGALDESYPYPIQQWELGEQIDWIFLGGEVVVEFAARLKSSRRQSSTWVAGYSNDVMAYIPSRRVWIEGGYEGASAMIYYGLPTRWAETVEETIIEAVGTAFPNE